MGDAKAIMEAKINGKKVMVFSKSYCPYCKMAKQVFAKYLGKELQQDDYEVWEMENDPKCSELQAALKTKTGASSVPRVFINGKCIGGGSETQDLDKSGKLRTMLTS